MKGDFTRFTFKPDKKYSSVRMQQGRVQLDADWNEQIDISSHRINTGTCDIIGPCGAPQDGGGFEIGTTSDKENLTISPGRIYVNGILCENFKDTYDSCKDAYDTCITNQKDLPDYSLPSDAGIYLAYLDVWQRHITAIEDPSIREVALGGPDTATRTKTVWQVKLTDKLNVPSTGSQIDCEAINEWNNIIKIKSDGMLAAFTRQETPTKNPCIISPTAGYRRLENQLYRVEIHDGGGINKAKFKWSRENGSVVFAIEDFINGSSGKTKKLRVKQLGRDKTLSLQAGDRVEVLDDAKELSQNLSEKSQNPSENPAGTLPKICEIDVAGRIITLDTDVEVSDKKYHPRIRRWDQKNESGAIPVNTSPSDSIELEDGIYVQFSGNSFKAGDYWLIPARTATENTQESGKIEWPQDECKNPPGKFMPPEGIVHHYCCLAVLKLDKQENRKNWTIISDCRKLFPAITKLTNFFHVCGDGQEAMPGEELPVPLQVGVSNGSSPVKGALVRFKIIDGGGTLSADNQVSNLHLIVKTDFEGVAECKWKLGSLDPSNPNIPPRQLVEARLFDACNKPIDTPPIYFNANLSVASQVAYTLPDCPKDSTNGFPTVEDLLKQKISGWPPVNTAGNISVKGMLDTFLCGFNAAYLPLDKDLCTTLNDSKVKTVQDALNKLCYGFGGGGCCVVVNNADELRKALQKLENGGTICLLAGEFKIESLSIINLHDIVIRGCTLASKIIGDIEIVSCQNIIIENLDILGSLKVTGELEGAVCQNVVIKNLNISGSVFVEKTYSFSLKKSLISQTNGQSFKMTTCSNTVIESNSFRMKGVELEFDNSLSLKVQKNDIITYAPNQEGEETFFGIVVRYSSDVEITDNRIVVFRSTYKANVIGIELKEVDRYTSVTNNNIGMVGGSCLEIQSNGPVRVQGNYLQLGSSFEQTNRAVEIVSSKDLIIFTDNLCDNGIDGNPKDNKPIYVIYIDGRDAIFSNNYCTFKGSFNTTFPEESAHVHIDGSFANVIGNRCIEENFGGFAIYAASEKSILIGNISTNGIMPPNTGQFNLQE